jgi:hypothetical protein
MKRWRGVIARHSQNMTRTNPPTQPDNLHTSNKNKLTRCLGGSRSAVKKEDQFLELQSSRPPSRFILHPGAAGLYNGGAVTIMPPTVGRGTTLHSEDQLLTNGDALVGADTRGRASCPSLQYQTVFHNCRR